MPVMPMNDLADIGLVYPKPLGQSGLRYTACCIDRSDLLDLCWYEFGIGISDSIPVVDDSPPSRIHIGQISRLWPGIPVVRSIARRIIAVMKDKVIFRNGSDKQLIADVMGTSDFCPIPEVSVSPRRRAVSRPRPAPIGVRIVHLFQVPVQHVSSWHVGMVRRYLETIDY